MNRYGRTWFYEPKWSDKVLLCFSIIAYCLDLNLCQVTVGISALLKWELNE